MFFFLEYAGELRIIVLRREVIQIQNPHPTLDQSEEWGVFLAKTVTNKKDYRT